jgi:homoserine O-acetyltransferase
MSGKCFAGRRDLFSSRNRSFHSAPEYKVFEMTVACANDKSSTDGSKNPGGQRTLPNPVPAQDYLIDIPSSWRGSMGARLAPNTKMKLRTIGNRAAPPVAVLGGISADRHVTDSAEHRGWWPGFYGSENAIDLSRYQIVSMDFLTGEEVREHPFTPADHADLLTFGLDQIGIPVLHSFVGASFGGMIALSFARQFPERLRGLVVLCAAHRPSAFAQGARAIQRQILQDYMDAGNPGQGIVLARALAMLTYRTSAELNERFSCTQKADGGVSEYIFARGKAFSQTMSAQNYRSLSDSIDHHFEQPEAISSPCLLIGVNEDQIVPVSDMRELAEQLAGPSHLHLISSNFGHDAFLKEINQLGPKIKQFIEGIRS